MSVLFPDFPFDKDLISSDKIAALGKVVAGLTGNPGLSAVLGLAQSIKEGSLKDALPGLVSDGSLPAKILDGGLDATEVIKHLKVFLAGTKQSSLGPALKLLKKSKCDATVLANPVKAKLPPPKNGIYPVMIWIKRDKDGKLPWKPYDSDDVMLADLAFGLSLWGGHLNIDIGQEYDHGESANLMISGRRGNFASSDVVAVGDIGPISQKKCRLIFNQAAKFSKNEFIYTVAHEFGHCLGVRHADVPQMGALMSPLLDLSDVANMAPKKADFNALSKKFPELKWDGTLDG